MRRVVVLFAIVAATSALTGCGPLISSYLVGSAEAAVAGATAAEADKYARYEVVAAREYLHKAKEEQGFADFGPAIDFASKAEDLARQAIARADVEKRRLVEPEGAEWAAPSEHSEPGEKPHVIIKKKGGKSSKTAPIPAPKPPPPKAPPARDDGDDASGDGEPEEEQP